MLFNNSLQNCKLYVFKAVTNLRFIKQCEIFEHGDFILFYINPNFLGLNASSDLRSFWVLGNM
jgi:hypothetical protein